MRAVKTYPYLRPSSELIKADIWRDEDGTDLNISEQIRLWDPITVINAQRHLDVNVSEIMETCKLKKDAKLQLQVIQYSSCTIIRQQCSGPFPSEIITADHSGNIELRIAVPGQELARDLRLITRLSLHDSGSTESRIAPRLPGSILWEETDTYAIEGNGSLFPIEQIEFTSDVQKAAWYLDISTDFYQPFLGGVRLYINSKHENIMSALTGRKTHDEKAKAIISTLYFDVGRQMIVTALRNPDFIDVVENTGHGDMPFEKDSIGRAIWAMLVTSFQNRSPLELKNILETNPAAFERILQHKLHFLEGA